MNKHNNQAKQIGMLKQKDSQQLSLIKKNKKKINKTNQKVNNLIKNKVNKKNNPKGVLSRFAFGLKYPFHPDALGTQVPDPFSFPTATYHMHNTTVLGNSVSSGYTLGCALFCPSPTLTVIDFLFQGILNSNASFVQQTPMQRYGSTTTLPPFGIFGATTASDIQAKFSTWRITSWGIKLSNLQPELSATGRMIIAPIPIGDTVPNYFELQGMTLASGLVPITGLPNGLFSSSSLLELPGAFEVSFGDLLHGDIEIAGMYTSMDFFDFKCSVINAQDGTNSYEGDSGSYISTTNLYTSNAFKDYTRMKGGVAFAIYCEGLPASTPNVLQVELIMHLEGVPTVTSTSNTGLVSSSLPTSHIGSTNEVESDMSIVATIERCVQFVTRGASFLNNNRREIVEGATIARQAYKTIMNYL